MTRPGVVVSAGASGIGRAIAERFAGAGAQVAVCDVDQNALCKMLGANKGMFGEVVDVSDETQVRLFVERVEAHFDSVDVLIKNAGIVGGACPIAALDATVWRRSFEVNVHGAFFLLRAVVPAMQLRGKGAIINISTGSVVTAPTNRADYIASKWAVEGLTRAAARELGPAGIRVNAIRPDFVDTPRMRAILAAKAESDNVAVEKVEGAALQFISMRTKVQPEEIAAMAVMLASDAARHVTGQIIAMDGNVGWEH